MKKVIALLLALLLPVCASAESLQERAAAPERLQTVFTSNTGKTEITVNAAVEIPTAGNVPIVAVTPGVFTHEDLLRAADAFIGAGAYNPPVRTVEELLQSGPQTGDKSVDVRIRAADREVDFLQWYNAQGMPTYCRLDGFERGQANVNIPIWPTTYTPCETPVHLRQRALDIQASIAPFMTLAAEGVTDGDMESSDVYQYIFTRQVAGIPAVHTADGCFSVSSAADIYSDRQFPYETLFIVITPEGKTKWCYLSPYQLGETLAEDTQLLTFDEVIRVAGTLLPLSLQYQEKYLAVRNQDKVRYTVDRITFGYIRVKQRNNPNEYILVPCWDFFNAEQADESLITINAIDGTVIDRDYGY